MHDDIRPYRSYNDFFVGNKSYSNGSNAYPLGDRKYSHKHFRKMDDGTLHIMYANRLEMDKDSNTRYNRRHLATVYQDNSIRLHNINDIGDYKMLEAVTGFSMTNDSKRGGLVIRAGGEKKYMHYGFKGLRFMLGDGAPHPDCKYEIRHRTLRPSEAHEYMKRYEEFLVTYPVMLGAMGHDAARDLFVEIRNRAPNPMNQYLKKWYLEETMKLLDQKFYVDAAVCFALASPAPIWFHPSNHRRSVDMLKDAVDRHFRREMLIRGPDDLFNIKIIQGGEYYPTSKWPLRVMVANNVATSL